MKKLSWLVPAVVCGGLTPLFALIILAARGDLGANPIATALNQLGLVAMILLIASLACTPLKIVAGLTWPLRIRKSLGLLGFFYACLHMLTYVALDQLFDLRAIWSDVTERPFIIVGVIAFLLLIPLAVTSTAASARRMGRNWKKLHFLAYVIAPLVIVHFTMRMKSDITQPMAYGAILAVLLLVRVVARRRNYRPRKPII